MNRNQYCHFIQERLTQLGSRLLDEDDRAREHVQGCDECFAVYKALLTLESAFQASDPEPGASLETGSHTARRVARSQHRSGKRPPLKLSNWVWAAAFGAAIALGLGSFYSTEISELFGDAYKQSSKTGEEPIGGVQRFATTEMGDGTTLPAKSGGAGKQGGYRYVVEGGDALGYGQEQEAGEAQSKDPDIATQERARLRQIEEYERLKKEKSLRRARTARKSGPTASTTGAIQGAVTYHGGENDGEPAPYATVVLTSDREGIDPIFQVTDESGSYRLSGIETGVYFLHAEETGHTSLERVRVTLFPGELKRENLQLAPSDMEMETMNVLANKDAIPDIERANPSRSLSAETIERIPLVNNRVQDLMRLMPGIMTNGTAESDDGTAAEAPEGKRRGFRTSADFEKTLDETRPSSGYLGKKADFDPKSANEPSRFGNRANNQPAESRLQDVYEELALRSPPPLDEFSDRNRISGLAFQSATGYWANTYIPGYQMLRQLRAKLQARSGARFYDPSGHELPLERVAAPYAQPFDPPEEGALAVTLHTDRTHIADPTRALIQIGLRGADRLSGRRPELNVHLVLDLTEIPDANAVASMRALVLALEDARNAGDRFSLYSSGPNGGRLVRPEEFRRGSVLVALERLFSADRNRSHASTVSLDEAIEWAGEIVGSETSDEEPLGTSLILVASPRDLGDDIDELERTAHELAVEGVHTSILGVGPSVPIEPLERLARAGQGSLQILEQPQEAEQAIDTELYASSRIIARAVRVKIHLPPSVKLVDILGSHKLGAEQTEAVRQAEQAIDVQVSRSLGIRSDRGKDDPGIQIVIPAFRAGDSHVILLDVVAETHGKLADVSVRYKDLIRFKNSVARDSLSLPRRPQPVGPLELNVAKNYIGHRLSERLRETSDALRSNHGGRALANLERCEQLLHAAMSLFPEWTADAELQADLALLRQYRLLLTDGAATQAQPREHLADSLLYYAYRKVMDSKETL